MLLGPSTLSPDLRLENQIQQYGQRVRANNAGLIERMKSEGQGNVMEIYNVAHSHRMQLHNSGIFGGVGKPPQMLSHALGRNVDVIV